MAKNVNRKGNAIDRLKGRSYIVFADGLGLLTLVQLVNSPIINRLATLPLVCAMVIATFVALAPAHATSSSNPPPRARRPSEHWTTTLPRPSEWQSYKDD